MGGQDINRELKEFKEVDAADNSLILKILVEIKRGQIIPLIP